MASPVYWRKNATCAILVPKLPVSAMKETIRKVKTAYEILAYPHCKDWRRQDNIEAELERDRQSFERDEVELNDEELRALSKLTAARNIPFDPQKCLYKAAEVLGTPESK